MTTIGASYVTLLDWVKRQKPGGGVDQIIEMLTASNPILQDAPVVEGNLPTGHRTTIRSGLPTVAWRKLNYGVAPSKSTTVQVDDTCGMLEGYSEVDKDLADLNGNAKEFRASEDFAFIESMNQEVAQSVIYASTNTAPEEIMGLTPRFNDGSAANKGNIVDGGGTTDDSNTSIWLVTWGPQTCHLIFPKGSKAGITMTDKGQVTAVSSTGAMHEVYRTHFQWKLGLTLRDWRYVVRIANIKIADLETDAVTGASLIDLAIKAFYKRPTAAVVGGASTRAMWYCNKTIAEYLHAQAKNTTNVNLALSEVSGQPVVKLVGLPVRVCDALVETEDPVTIS